MHIDDEEDGSDETEDFDEEAWKAAQERQRKEKLAKYHACLTSILTAAVKNGSKNLSDIAAGLSLKEITATLIPNVQIFKEIMVELLKARSIDVMALRTERASFIKEESNDFRLNMMILEIMDEHPDWPAIKHIEISRIEGVAPVIFAHVLDEDGNQRSIRCSDVMIRTSRE